MERLLPKVAVGAIAAGIGLVTVRHMIEHHKTHVHDSELELINAIPTYQLDHHEAIARSVIQDAIPYDPDDMNAFIQEVRRSQDASRT